MKSILYLFALLLFACESSNSSVEEVSIDATMMDQGTVVVMDQMLVDQMVEVDQAIPMNWTPPHIEDLVSLEDLNMDPNIVEYELTAKEVDLQIDQGRPFTLWTYNGLLPGPVIQAKVGDRVIIHFRNELSEPTTIHWHGLRISDQMDGNPRIQTPVQPGEIFTYDFVVPDAGTFWYHPHVRTNEQIEKGLYGAFIVHNPEEIGLFAKERVIFLDDILLDQFENIAPEYSSFPERMRGRYGNRLLINGKLDTFKSATSAQQHSTERWRIVNPANARVMFMRIPDVEYSVIGTDGGRIEPYQQDILELGVGTRFDLSVKLPTSGDHILNIGIPFLDEQGNIQTDWLDAYTVDTQANDQTPSDVVLPVPPMIDHRMPTENFEIVLDAVEDPVTQVRFLVNGESHPQAPLFTYPKGTTVKIKIKNLIGPPHPFHMHGQFFEIVPNNNPETHLPGLKDTVLLPGLEEIEIIAYLDNPGRWMLHCHVLEHSELGMMSEFVVTDPNQPQP